MKPKIWIDMKVHTPEGIVLQETSEEGHSWVRNFYNLYATFMVDSSVLGTGLDVFDDANVKSGSGTPREYAGNTSSSYYHFWRGADGTGDGNGIRLGISNEPFDVDDFDMPGLINHGNGAGQLYHYAMPARTISFNRNKWQLSVIFKRIFSNNSGDTIVIRETGMYSMGRYSSSTTTVLMLRDILATPVSVPHGALITCTYTLASPEFLEVLKEPLYKMGDAGSGGYYWKQMTGSVNTHLKYALILAPVNGGLSTALKWSSNTSNAIGATDEYYGYDNTQKLIAQGATSPIGQFVANANANKLGGYDDWYIPARYEYHGIATSFNPVAPAGEETPTGISLWSSTESTTTQACSFNVDTNSGTISSNKNSNTYQVRLVRRILHRSFIPKIEE